MAIKSTGNTFTICAVSTEANMQLFQIFSAFLHFFISNKVVIAFLYFRVLAYHKNGTHTNLVDPTEDIKWVQRKADKLGFVLKPSKKYDSTTVVCPNALKHEIANKRNAIGWTKSLAHMPRLSLADIEDYHKKVNESLLKNSSTISKPFVRGRQLLNENFIDFGSIYAKENDKHFFLKGVCGASLKKANRWIFLALLKSSRSVDFVFCSCPAGKLGTCAHSFAVLKLVAKWAIDGLKFVPEPKACTSSPCVWSKPQGVDRTDKIPATELNIKSPRRTGKESDNKKHQGVQSTLYAACSTEMNVNSTALKNLLAHSFDNHATHVIQNAPNSHVDTLYGQMPIGSVLSYQCSLMPSGFKVYANLPTAVPGAVIQSYPMFPFTATSCVIQGYIDSIMHDKELNILKDLKKDAESAVELEEKTRGQSTCQEWFRVRKHRFTASLFYQIGDFDKKTVKGLTSSAKKIVKPVKEIGHVLKMKLSFGRYYEPIAIKMYERYMKTIGHNVSVEECGFVIDKNNYILGATPDGKVTDGSFGIMEVKCSEEYRDNDPKDICFVSKHSCLAYNAETDTITINKNHAYYKQIQMQLSMTTQTWCDFIFYTSKGMVIDRIQYDKSFWEILQNKVVNFYFNYMLPEIVETSIDA